MAALSWVSTAYVLLQVTRFYLHIGDVRRHHVESAVFIFVAFLLLLIASRPSSGEPLDIEPPSRGRLPMAALSAAFLSGAVLLYWPTLTSGLFADDYVLLAAARGGRLTVWGDLFRPLPLLLWRVVDTATSHTPAALHTINVLLHGVNSLLVAVVARGMGLPRPGSAAAGVLFLCFPAAVEPVVWAAGIQDVLMTSFVLAFVALAVHASATAWPMFAAGIVVVMALLTKETAVATPLLGVIAGLGRGVRRQALTFAAVAAIVTAAFLALRFSVLPLPDTYATPLTRYTVKELLVRPFATLAVPLRELEVRALPALAIALGVLIVVPLRAAAGRWRRQTVECLIAVRGIAFVLAAIGPVFSFFYIDPDLLGSRYLYLPAAGWAIALAAIHASAAPKHGAVQGALLLGVLIVWIAAGRSHMRVWIDAAAERDRILAAAEQAAAAGCQAWAVYGVPPLLRGVPTFINGFPEAASAALPGRIRMAPAVRDPEECRLTWNGRAFRRD